MATVDRNVEVLREIQEAWGLIPVWTKGIPSQALEGFWTLTRDFELADTKIPHKYKDLIALAVSGATRCRYCQLFHAEGARLHGASEEELHEAAMIGSIAMLGSTYLNTVGADYEQFRAEVRRIVAHVRVEQEKAGKRPPLVGPDGRVRPTSGTLGH